jgi:very-short-patch-repair endonuclease
MSRLEEQFAAQLANAGLPAPVREHVFAKPRRWRIDFAWPERRLAIEIDGATWSGGRHNRGSGLERDYEKLNALALLGWTVLRFSSSLVRSGEALRFTQLAFGRRIAA